MDHISIPILDASRTRAFYEPALNTLGWQCTGFREGVYVGFKKKGSAALYFAVAPSVASVHLALKASTQEQVAQFYRAALEAGGTVLGGVG